MNHSRYWLLTAVLCIAPAAVFADTVTLKNGREIHGRMIKESKDAITIRTSGGTIKISKAEVATFNENENYGTQDKPETLVEREAREKRLAEARKKLDERKKKKGGDDDDDDSSTKPKKKFFKNKAERDAEAKRKKAADAASAKNAKTASLTKDGWKWGKGVSGDAIEALKPVRDKLHKDLEALGPSEAEVMAEIELTSAEKATLKDLIPQLGWNRRRRRPRAGGGTRAAGGSGIRRRNALDNIIKDFGIRALPSLVESMGSSNFWIARMSSQGVGRLAKGAKDRDKAQWLMYHLDAPTKLIKNLDNQGETDSPYIRKDANEALEFISGKNFAFKPSTQPLRTNAESTAYRKWRDWWKKEQAEWTKREKEKQTKRDDIFEKLESIQKGEDPDAKGDDDDAGTD